MTSTTSQIREHSRLFQLATWLLLCAALTLGCITPAQASNQATNNLIVALAYWEDTSGQADFTQAKSQTYTPYSGLFSRGYKNSVHWIRLTLTPNSTPTTLVAKPTWLDSVTLYAPSDAPITTLGDLHPTTANRWAGLGYAFELPPSQAQRDVWLRLQTTSSHVLMVQALPSRQSQKTVAKEIFLVSAYACIQILVLSLLTFIWINRRDSLLGRYIVRDAILTAYGILYLGVPFIFYSDNSAPELMHYAFAFFVVILAPATIQFDLAFLSRYQPKKLWMNLLKTIMWLSTVVILLLIFGFTKISMQMNILISISAIFFMFLAAVSTIKNKKTNVVPSKKVMLTYYFIVMGSLPIGLINLLGYFELQTWALYGIILHGLITGLVMTFFLLRRSQHLANKHQVIAWELNQERKRTELQKKRREEQSQFLHMLMHEIKTPLSIVSMALGTKSNHEENLEFANRAVRDMNAILDRCVQADQIGELIQYQNQESLELKTLLLETACEVNDLEETIKIHQIDGLSFITSDRQILKIIFLNILSNCARYRIEKTPVSVTIKSHKNINKDGFSIIFSNTPGIAGWPEENKIFKKYYRSAGAHRQSGCGLGLYLSRQLAKSLGGELKYVPTERFVEFELWIPTIKS